MNIVCKNKIKFSIRKVDWSFIIRMSALLIALSPLRIDGAAPHEAWTGIGLSQGFQCGGKGFWIGDLAVDAYGAVYVYTSCPMAGIGHSSSYVKWDGKTWGNFSGAGIGGNRNLIGLLTDKKGGFYGIFQDLAAPSYSNVLAQWDGTAWRVFEDNFSGNIVDIAVTRSGGIFVCGNFYSVKDTSVKNIARWDNQKWRCLGNGIGNNCQVNAIVCNDSGHVFAAGCFNTADLVKARNIAKWDGAAWVPLAGGLNGEVVDLAMNDRGILYAGGSFDSAGDIPVHHIAAWNGNSWSALGKGIRHVPGDTSPVTCLAFNDSGNLYIGGHFDTVGSVFAGNIAQWDGTAWSALGSGITGSVGNIAFDNKNHLFALGMFTAAGGKAADWIAQWNGSEWFAVGPKDGNGLNREVADIVIDKSGNICSGGSFTSAGTKTIGPVAKWEGSTWSAVGGGLNLNVEVKALAVDSAGNMYAGGRTRSDDSVFLAQWDGKAWRSLITRRSSGCINALTVDRAGTLYAGGSFVFLDSIGARNIAKWNGASWDSLGLGINGVVSSFTIDSKGILYAGGNFDTAGPVIAHNIAKWDGTAWSSLGRGFNAPNCVLATDKNDNVYAGGGFQYAGSKTVYGIAKWDGHEWSALGSGIMGYVKAITFDDYGNLYAGGDLGLLDSINESDISKIAKWDGKAWNSLESGVNGSVNDLIIDKNILYVGGTFDSAGGKVSINFALCTLDNSARTAHFSYEKASPPFFAVDLGKSLVRIHLKSENIVDIRMYSLLGRRLYFFSGKMTAGDHDYRFSTAGLAPGIYIAQVKAASRSIRWKVAIGR
jgi:hypothetical protein